MDEKQVRDADSPQEEKILHHGEKRHGSNIPADLLAHSHDADEAMKAMAENEGLSLEIDEATNKRLLRKIDMTIMPILCIVYGLNYLDKTTISYASVMGIKKDIGLVGDDYQWLGSLFYFGYLGWEYPTNWLLQRLPIGKYSAFNIIMWGITLSCFAGVTNFSGAVAVRFFLGLFEAAVTPGFAFITSQWYTKREQAYRIGIWFSFNGWAQILGGLVAYAIDRGVAAHGAAIDSWKIVFLVTGLLTACMGILFYFIVPDNQLNAWFLNKQERILAIERIRKNEQGVGNKHWKMYQFKEALLDPLTWLFFLYALIGDIPNGGITNFFSQLIVSFGYTETQSLLYGTPGGAVEVVTITLWGWLSYHYGNRIFFGACSLSLSIMGIILIVALPLDNPKGRLAGYYFTQASATSFVALLSLISSNVAGYTKKTTVAAIYLVGYCAGNIIGPQTFRPKDAPRYVPGEITILVCWCLCLILLGLIWAYCKYQNRQKQKLREQPGYEKLSNQEFLDLTDRENPEFVYST
ncbi:MAG: hypothetical protein M1828_003483 [Chrysothrix sp. TS-e1954]|nr:MAG: hypothetical protein M1828_003483 [Chrysothrix sp. TS-e1954]